MYYRSLYPPVPTLPPQNYVDFVLCRPEAQSFPDCRLYIDASTGAEIRRRAFIDRVEDAAVGLKTGVHEGGLELTGLKGDVAHAEDREIVGILSENCMVCMNYRR